MGLVVGKCKWGHDISGLVEESDGALKVPATLCPLCLTSLDPNVRANAGRVMHPDRYDAWTAKKP